MGNFCGARNQQGTYQGFIQKNRYHPKETHTSNELRHQIARSIIPSESPSNKQDLIKYISQQNQQIFHDKNFSILQVYTQKSDQIKKPIHLLYNYERRKMRKVYHDQDTSLDAFRQQQSSFTYLTSVFYLICRSKKLKQQIFLTKIINKYNGYVLRLFCNGQPCQVVIDDQVPMNDKSKIKYLSLEHGLQIWPFLIQKAWCKQIGGYDKAQGLSPQDCFEEITGIPALSTELTSYNDETLLRKLRYALQKGYWVVLTAKKIPQAQFFWIQSQQVFLLEAIGADSSDRDDRTEVSHQKFGGTIFKIRSPYSNDMPVNLQRSRNYNPTTSRYQNLDQSRNTNISLHANVYAQSRRIPSNSLQKDLRTIREYFRYFTIGYYQPDYQCQVIQFSSYKRQQKVFDLIVKEESKINIRLIQFYDEYLGEVQKNLYKYSPVTLELYDRSKRLVKNADNYSHGYRSASLIDFSTQFNQQEQFQPFINLKPGQYYLRVNVQWFSDEYSQKANLVMYSQSNYGNLNCTLRKFEGSEQRQRQFCAQLVAGSLFTDENLLIERQNKSQNLKIRCLQKNFSYVVGIYNLDRSHEAQLKVSFKDMSNLKLNHKTLKMDSEVSAIDHIKIPANAQQVLEFIPLNGSSAHYIRLGTFDILKYQ